MFGFLKKISSEKLQNIVIWVIIHDLIIMEVSFLKSLIAKRLSIFFCNLKNNKKNDNGGLLLHHKMKETMLRIWPVNFNHQKQLPDERSMSRMPFPITKKHDFTSAIIVTIVLANLMKLLNNMLGIPMMLILKTNMIFLKIFN